MKLTHPALFAFKLLVLSLAALWAGDGFAAGAAKPNIVFILADDLGYGDPSCCNPQSKIQTPNLDRIRREGMMFTDGHAPASVCVPTRYGIMTGRYPFRMRRGDSPSLIDENHATIGGLLQSQGYRTVCLGKWHLGIGGKSPDYRNRLAGGPIDRGFDMYFGIPASLDIPPYYWISQDRAEEAPTATIEARNTEGWTPIQGEFWRAGGVAPHFRHDEVLPKLTNLAVDTINKHAQVRPNQPLFMYLALPAPHTPWLPDKRFRGKSGASMYGDFVLHVDDTVGQVLEALDKQGMAENTLLIFSSDNGPTWYDQDEEKYDHFAAGPLRGMKGDAWEGGHRVPFLVRWPGQVKPGSTSKETICQTDLFATAAAVLGVERPETAVDSVSFLPALRGEPLSSPLREYTVHQSSRGVLAVRRGPWKMIPQLGSGGFTSPQKREPAAGEPPGQLYNLEKDLGEQQNLWNEHPQIVQELTNYIKQLRSQ